MFVRVAETIVASVFVLWQCDIVQCLFNFYEYNVIWRWSTPASQRDEEKGLARGRYSL